MPLSVRVSARRRLNLAELEKSITPRRLCADSVTTSRERSRCGGDLRDSRTSTAQCWWCRLPKLCRWNCGPARCGRDRDGSAIVRRGRRVFARSALCVIATRGKICPANAGRLVGRRSTSRAKRGFVLTLATREHTFAARRRRRISAPTRRWSR